MSNQIPDGWDVVQLGDVTDIVMGQSPPSSTYNLIRQGLPLFQGKSDFGVHNPQVKMWCSEPTKIASKNSILFSVRAPVGDVNVTLTRCCIGRGLSAISAKNISKDYLL